MLNYYLLILWPISLVGILIQAASEEQVLKRRFGHDYERYAERTGRLAPRFWRQTSGPDAALDHGKPI
jgi:protein-S-isoprenylcysteine O-methyltransferase Ste14